MGASGSWIRAWGLLGLTALAVALRGAVDPLAAACLFLATALVTGAVALLPRLPGMPRDLALLAVGWLAVGALSLLWSRAPDATLDRLAAMLAVVGVALVASGLRGARARRLLADGLGVVGTLTAAAALVSVSGGERARLPFGNPNHLAAWLLLPAGLVWMALGRAGPARPERREAMLLCFAALGVMGAALAATQSRGAGLAAGAAALGVAAIRRLGPRVGPGMAAGGIVAGAVALAALPWAWPEGLPSHTGIGESSAGLRWSVYAATARLALEAGPLGVGLGAFSAVFDAYRPAGLAYSPNFAHSEPLQAVAELGLLFLVAASISLAVAVRRLGRVLERGSRVTWGALAGLLAVAAHALVDFPLHVPAIALTAAALAGLLFAGGGVPVAYLGPRASRALLGGVAVALLALAGSGLVAVHAERVAAQQLASGAFAEAVSSAGRGLQARPARPALWSLLADASEHAARFDGGGPEALERALAARRRAAELRGGDASLRRRMAHSLARVGRLEDAGDELRHAAALDPASPAASVARARLALLGGDGAAASAALRGAIERHPRAGGTLLRAALHASADPGLLREAPADSTLRASLLAQSGFVLEAAAEYERLFAADPAELGQALRAVRLYRRAGAEDAAGRLLARALRSHPGDPRLERAAARGRRTQGQSG